ncbi:MAG TPA: glycosyltransferase [Chthoniobacterales bacterium]|nr:glycosyltransferase [Chthoniobacterales bacterium]
MPDVREFSVIVPSYNRSEPVRACLRSLTAMDYPRDRFEVIVVDDGSREPVDGLATDFEDVLHLKILRKKHEGPAAARNHGAAHAKGKFLAFTDDDCTASPSWLRALGERLTTAPQDLVGGKIINALDSNIYSAASQMILDTVYEHYNPALGRAHFFASCNFAMTAEKFRALEGFEQDWSLAGGEDRAFCYRWIHRGWKLNYAPEAVIVHHHALDLRSFCGLYLRYGRGAYYYHQRVRRGAAGPGGFRPDPMFYWRCFRRPWTDKKPARAFRITCLLFVWQLANAAGYLSQRFAQRDD